MGSRNEGINNPGAISRAGSRLVGALAMTPFRTQRNRTGHMASVANTSQRRDRLLLVSILSSWDRCGRGCTSEALGFLEGPLPM